MNNWFEVIENEIKKKKIMATEYFDLLGIETWTWILFATSINYIIQSGVKHHNPYLKPLHILFFIEDGDFISEIPHSDSAKIILYDGLGLYLIHMLFILSKYDNIYMYLCVILFFIKCIITRL
jgi:hypothetical protein